ncbi:MAG TPA: CoA-transferase [Miltoncostaeaceae bacterium]|nr:CoA-transferase [Miltoncostaeaceae bacterium]
MSAALGTWDDLVGAVQDGATVGIGGAGMSRKPVDAVLELARAGRRDLDLVTFVGSLDVEVLLAAGAVRSITSSAVSLGLHGRAPRFSDAVAGGSVDDREMSEWMLVGGLRAAAMGVPFLPTRAALGSDLVTARGLRRVVDPYSGESYLAVPALRPDVAIIQAWRADERGNVQVPWPPDHLWDVDVVLARATRTTVVCAEEVVPHETIARDEQLTRLFSFEVDLVVPAAGGSWPTAFTPLRGEDGAWLHGNAADPGGALLEASGPRDVHPRTDHEVRR